jgi:Protein of unknown function (DUF1573)
MTDTGQMAAPVRRRGFLGTAPRSIRLCVLGGAVFLFLAALCWRFMPADQWRLDYWDSQFSCLVPDYDFGNAPANARITHDFVVRNNGNKTLKVIGLSPGCNCLSLASSALSLEKDEESRITAVLSLAGLHGQINRSIEVVTNDPVFPRAELVMRGEVTTVYDVSRYSVKLRAWSDNNNPVESVIISGKKDTKPFHIVSSEASTRVIDVSSREVAPSKYIVEFRPARGTQGPTSCRVVVNTDNPAESMIIIDVSVNPESKGIGSPAAQAL